MSRTQPKQALVPYPFIDGLTHRQQEELYEDFLYLGKQAGGTRWATIVIAASDTSAAGKTVADIVCTGVNDELKINAAISSLQSGRAGTTGLGRIVLLEGSFFLGNPIAANNFGARQLVIQGMGGGGQGGLTIAATRLVATTTAAVSFVGSGTGAGSTITIQDLGISAASNSAFTVTLQDITAMIHDCYITNTGTGGCLRSLATTGGNGGSKIENNEFISTGTAGPGIKVAVGSGFDKPIAISNNYVQVLGAATAIECVNDSGTIPTYTISDNYIIGNATAGSVGIQLDGNSIEACAITGNTIRQVGTGVLAAGYRHLIAANLIDGCTIGVDSAAFSPQYHFVVSNQITGWGTAAVRWGSNINTVMDTGTIAFNKFGNGTGTAVIIGSGCTNCGVFYNDTFGASGGALSDSGTATRTEGWFLTVAGLPIHHVSHESGGFDAITGNVDGNARVGARKNTAGSTFKRRRINFIEGSNIAITLADDSLNEEIDVTIAASTGGGTITVKNNGVTVGAENTLNFLPGSGVTYSMTDTGTEIDITINASGAANAAATEHNWLFHT